MESGLKKGYRGGGSSSKVGVPELVIGSYRGGGGHGVTKAAIELPSAVARHRGLSLLQSGFTNSRISNAAENGRAGVEESI